MEKTIEEYLEEMRRYAKRSNQTVTEVMPVIAPATPGIVGELIILVTHSRGTFPVENAEVTIFDRDNNVIKKVTTDNSGRTDRIILQALPKALSESPNDENKDVSKFYNARIDAENFVSVLIKNIPVFEGITSLQSYDMLYKGAASSQELQVIELPITSL